MAFQNSTAGPRARMTLKGEGRDHEGGGKGQARKWSPPVILTMTATMHWGRASHP